jgi:hypothetical protein
MVQRKSPMGGSGLPGNLSDCSSKDPAESEIFLVREIPQVERQNRDVTDISRLFFH